MIRLTKYTASELNDEIHAEVLPLMAELHTERGSEDPLPTLENMASQLRSIPSYIRLILWLARSEKNEVVGEAILILIDNPEQAHLAPIKLSVSPRYRRRGLGRRLFSVARAAAIEEKRRVVDLETDSRVPAGAAFARSLGAMPGLVSGQNRLYLAEVNRDEIEAFRKAPPGFSPVLWRNETPDEWLTERVRLSEVYNDIPTGDLDLGDIKLTPERLRDEEAGRARAGIQSWTLAARDDATGKLAGLTELHWNPTRPHVVQQQITGVSSDYRGRGLGLFLKAELLQTLLAECPEARFISTDNADSNAGMRRINERLGYRRHVEVTSWQRAV